VTGGAPRGARCCRHRRPVRGGSRRRKAGVRFGDLGEEGKFPRSPGPALDDVTRRPTATPRSVEFVGSQPKCAAAGPERYTTRRDATRTPRVRPPSRGNLRIPHALGTALAATVFRKPLLDKNAPPVYRPRLGDVDAQVQAASPGPPRTAVASPAGFSPPAFGDDPHTAIERRAQAVPRLDQEGPWLEPRREGLVRCRGPGFNMVSSAM